MATFFQRIREKMTDAAEAVEAVEILPEEVKSLYESLPEEVRQEITRDAIQEQIKSGAEAGAQLIIERVTEGASTPTAIQRSVTYSPEELKAMEAQANKQLESEIYAAKYPNAPAEVVWDAGKHLDYMFSDPINFWADVAKTWVAQGGGEASAEYAQAVRTLIVDSIPVEHYAPMYDMLDLNHIIFVATHIFPENYDYLNWRYVAGPDNRLEEWINGQVSYMKTLSETGTEEEILSFRDAIIGILNTHRPDFLKHVPETLQIEFIRNFTPEILDAIDKQVMDEKLKEKRAKTAMLWIGGLAAGGLILAVAKGRGKTQGPVIISKG